MNTKDKPAHSHDKFKTILGKSTITVRNHFFQFLKLQNFYA